jgi:isoleucyl-tRNA synthetase
MPFASLHYPFENKKLFDANFPADFIAEGLDQTRGWFYSLINLGVGLFGKAPYKHVIVNGLVLAKGGKKFSKSEKNYTDPMLLVERYGADSVRYFLLNSPIVKGESVEFYDEGVEEVYKKNIVRLENVISLYEMYKEASFGELEVITKRNHILDTWIVERLHEVIAIATKGFDSCALDEAVRPIEGFIDDLSVWYTRRSRDRLKGDTTKEDKYEAEETLVYVLQNFAKVLAPSMPFLAERIYKGAGGAKESVHLTSWPKLQAFDQAVLDQMKKTREVVSLGLMKRNEVKIPVRQPLAKVMIKDTLPEEYKKEVLDELNVKEVITDTSLVENILLDTVLTKELIEEGDMRKIIRAIQDQRKAKGLNPKDIVSIIVSKPVTQEVSNTCGITVTEDASLTEGVEVPLSEGVFYFKM